MAMLIRAEMTSETLLATEIVGGKGSKQMGSAYHTTIMEMHAVQSCRLDGTNIGDVEWKVGQEHVNEHSDSRYGPVLLNHHARHKSAACTFAIVESSHLPLDGKEENVWSSHLASSPLDGFYRQ